MAAQIEQYASERVDNSLDPLLAAPRVGDLYAAELTAFSGSSFEFRGKVADGVKAFGLLKVVAVEDDQVVAISEMSAWPLPRGAINDVRGDQADIEWDESEKIRIKRTDFRKLVGAGQILEARRPNSDPS